MKFFWMFAVVAIVGINAGCIANKDIKVSDNKVSGLNLTVTSSDAETLKAQNASLTNQVSALQTQLADKDRLQAKQSDELKAVNSTLSDLQHQVRGLQNTLSEERQETAATLSHHARANSVSWYITTIDNRTSCAVEFCVLSDHGQWERKVLHPNQQITLSRMQNRISISFGQQWSLETTQVPGDQQGSPGYYFGVDRGGYITLYANH